MSKTVQDRAIVTIEH